MTKLTSLIIILLCWLSLASASDILMVHTTRTAAGDTGKFNLVLKNASVINGLNFVVKYNRDLISPRAITPVGKSTLLTGSTSNPFGGNKIGFLLYDAGANQLAPDSGAIFEVEYIVSDSVADSTSTEIVFLEGMAADSALAVIPLEYVNGTILITPFVGVDRTSPLPQVYQLSQNYPNPFNPTTTIHFELPKSGHVTLMVFNILGQQTLRVLDEKRDAGVYDVSIDGTRMASGVYFYRLMAGSFSQTKKMLLIK